MTWTPRPFPAGDGERLLERARGRVSADRLAERCLAIVDIPSPTGHELPLASWLAERLGEAGFDGAVQRIDDRQGNAVGRLGERGDGPGLLLYAPIDTAFGDDRDELVAWLGGAAPGPELGLPGAIRDGWVIGLGAENPKSYVACILEAATAFAEAGIVPRGELLVGLAGGGMPDGRRDPATGRSLGHGVGCAHMLAHGVRPDAALIVKPGYAVAWEEVGLSWHRITVRGERGYTGLRHKGLGRNPIPVAAELVSALERWFPGYTARHTSGLVSPQGSVGAIAGGRPELAAFFPTSAEVVVDLRVSPRSTSREVHAELGELVAEFAAGHPGFAFDLALEAALDAPPTDEDAWIVRATVDAWERLEGRPHVPRTGTSGSTDAAVLRAHGIPTARVGPPAPAGAPPASGFSMGHAELAGMRRLVDLLLDVMVAAALAPGASVRR